MPAFLEYLSSKLVDRWLARVLPGLLFVTTLFLAGELGQRHWADLSRITDAATDVSNSSFADSGPASIVVILVVLAVAAGAGSIAGALGQMLRRLWIEPWPWFLRVAAARLTARRRSRWMALAERYENDVLRLRADNQVDEEALRSLGEDRNRIALAVPVRPTWMGDRITAAATRVQADYGLDLASAWPRLWLLASPEQRAPVQQTVAELDTAATLAVWGSGYLVVGAFWWPSALLGLALIVAGRQRGRRAVDGYAELAEAIVDLGLSDLAQRLGIAGSDVAEVGAEITSRLRKGA